MMDIRRRVLQDAPQLTTVIGNPVSFRTNINAPLDQCKVEFSPVQSSGTPSPSNILPISGWTGVTVNVSPTTSGGTTYPISWTDQGTVFCGSIDIANGTLIKTHNIYELTGTESGASWSWDGYLSRWDNSIDAPNNASQPIICCSHTNTFITGSQFFNSRESSNFPLTACVSQSGGIRYRDRNNFTNLETAKTYLKAQYDNGTPVQMVVKRATPQTIQLTPQQIKTLIGQNNIWSNANGDITIKYWKH